MEKRRGGGAVPRNTKKVVFGSGDDEYGQRLVTIRMAVGWRDEGDVAAVVC